MHHFSPRDGVLHAEDVDLRDVAAAVGTPFYCYSRATIERPCAKPIDERVTTPKYLSAGW